MLIKLYFSTNYIIRQRSSDAWFDKKCRDSECFKRKLESRYLRSQCKKKLASWVLQVTFQETVYARENSSETQNLVTQTTNYITWSCINKIFSRGKCNPVPGIDEGNFQKHLTDKIESVKKSLPDNRIPQFSFCNPDVGQNKFAEVDENEVILAIEKLPNKHCSLDPIPTCFLRKISRLISPFLTNVFKNSFSVGFVPDLLKLAHISLLLKKPSLDTNDVSSYRPISNLSVLNKLLERLVLARLSNYLTENKFFLSLQSAYHRHHSTETAISKIYLDILKAAEKR